MHLCRKGYFIIITYNQEDFDKFSKIAPVVVAPESTMTSVERMEFLGSVTGRETEAKAAIDDFETKLAEKKFFILMPK